LALDSLLNKVHELDAEVAQLRKDATYAGGEDPYKVPKIIED
jgi:ribosome-binding factor A